MAMMRDSYSLLSLCPPCLQITLSWNTVCVSKVGEGGKKLGYNIVNGSICRQQMSTNIITSTPTISDINLLLVGSFYIRYDDQ